MLQSKKTIKPVLMLTSLAAAMALSPVLLAQEDRDETTARSVVLVQKIDAETQAKYDVVAGYYAADGIMLSQKQVIQLIADKPEVVALAESASRALQGTNGTAHMEVNGEGKIRSESCAPFEPFCSTTNKWAGLYVHTPNEAEALLGYREFADGVFSTSSSSSAVWAISPNPDVSAHLGKLSSGLLFNQPAYGVLGTANSADATTNYGVYGSSNQANGYGVYGNNTSGGKAGYFNGPVELNGSVEQNASFGGVVKAAVFADCGSVSFAMIHRSFSPSGTTPSITGGAVDGRCSIDFGFDISTRFFQATASHSTSARGVSCSQGATDSSLDCFRYFVSDGAATGGGIMVTVY